MVLADRPALQMAFVVEFNGDYQQYEHSKTPNTFIEYSKEYYITDSGYYTLILRNDHQNGSEYDRMMTQIKQYL